MTLPVPLSAWPQLVQPPTQPTKLTTADNHPRYDTTRHHQEEGRNRVAVNVKVHANFSSKLFGQNVVIKVPVPANTAKTTINVSAGRARFEPEHRAIVWRIKRFPGGCEYMITADVQLMPSTSHKAWSRPPIQVGG